MPIAHDTPDLMKKSSTPHLQRVNRDYHEDLYQPHALIIAFVAMTNAGVGSPCQANHSDTCDSADFPNAVSATHLFDVIGPIHHEKQ